MPIEGITDYFFNQGVLGVIIIVLAIVIVLQDRRNRKDLKDSEELGRVLQEKRVVDSNTYSEKFIMTSQQLLNQNKEMISLIQVNQKSIEIITNILQSIKK